MARESIGRDYGIAAICGATNLPARSGRGEAEVVAGAVAGPEPEPPMTAAPYPPDFRDLVDELADAGGPTQLHCWLLGTVARRNVLPLAARADLAARVAARQRAFAA